MKKKDRNYNLNLYLTGLRYEIGLREVVNTFKELNIDINSFEKYYNLELEDLEKTVIYKFYIEKKTLKGIARELNLSYSYIRKVYLDAKEKMRIILSLHTKN